MDAASGTMSAPDLAGGRRRHLDSPIAHWTGNRSADEAGPALISLRSAATIHSLILALLPRHGSAVVAPPRLVAVLMRIGYRPPYPCSRPPTDRVAMSYFAAAVSGTDASRSQRRAEWGEDAFHVLRQQVAVSDQAVRRAPYLIEVGGLAGIAFLDRPARVAFRCAFALGRRERDRRSHQAHQLVGGADLRMAQIPPGIGRQRHRDIGQANAAQLIAVRVDPRNEMRVGLALRRGAAWWRPRWLPPGRNRAASPAADALETVPRVCR